MLREKGLTQKLLLLGIDGMDPRFTRRLVDEGKMPNTKKFIEKGAARQDLMLLGAIPTITPPMWATLATGAYPMTHGIMDFNLSAPDAADVTIGAFFSNFLKAEPLWNVTAEAGKKTLVWHWPGGSWPPTTDNPNLMVVDGSSPGSVGMVYATRDFDTMFIASDKAEKVSYMPYSVKTSEVVGDEKLEFMSLPQKSPNTPEFKEKMKRYFDDYRKDIEVHGYHASEGDCTCSVQFEEDNGLMWMLADFPTSCSISPIFPANGWHIDIPAESKEFVLVMGYGKITRYALILKNEQGKYDRVAIYKNKDTQEPLVILENDVFTPYIYDKQPSRQGEEKVMRNMRMLKIAEDGSYVRIWSSRSVSCEDDCVWYPKTLFKEIVDRFGPPLPTSQMTGNDADLILKCNNEQWKLAANWQAKSLKYMIDEHDVDVIFSHYHGPDLQGHNYMKYLKERDTSRYSEDEVVKFAEATYKVTDDYIGEFLPYLDKGWTIIIFSDHAQICPEEQPHVIGESCGVNADPLRQFGYTVLKKDENGHDLPEVDWSKTTAIQTRANSIYLNIKGRDPHGIVDPADKYELEEKIITDLYSYRDKKTGHRVVSLALHNKDAVLLGLGGPMGSDIVLCVHDDYGFDHGNTLSTACGHNDTTVSPIFMAAGSGVKENYCINRYIREVDVAPTAAVLLGVDMPAQCEGAPAYQIFTEKM